MVAQLLRLRSALVLGGFRRGRVEAVLLALGAGGAIVLGVLAALAAGRLQTAVPHAVAPWLTVLGALAGVAFLLGPLVFGPLDGLDPRRFALLGIGTARLSTGLLLGGVLTAPSLAILIAGIGTAAVWARPEQDLAIALLAGLLGALVCIMLARVGTALAGLLRRGTGGPAAPLVAGIVGIALAVVAVAILWLLDRSSAPGWVSGLAGVLGWSPLGAAWSAPAWAFVGDAPAAWLKLGVALVFLVLLVALHAVLVARATTTPLRRSSMRPGADLGLLGLLPATPLAMVAGRSAISWWRDPRYRIALLPVLLLPVLVIGVLAVAGVPWTLLLLLPAPLMCLLLGWLPHNDIAHDYSAFWLHVATGVDGRDDRVGRILPTLAGGLLVLLIGAGTTALLAPEPWQALSVAGLSAAFLGLGLGVSSVLSVLLPYPAVRPGDSPFQQPQTSGGVAMLAQASAMVAALLAATPTIVLFFLGTGGGWLWPLLTLVLGAVSAAAGLWFGIEAGARFYRQRLTETFALVLKG